MDTIKSLRKIFLIDLIGLTINGGIFYYLVKSGDLNLNIEVKAAIQIAMMILMLLLLLVGIGIYQLLASKSKKLDDEKENEQIKLYKNAVLIKFSTLSTTAVLSIIMYILTVSNSYLYLAGIAIVYLMTSLPSELRFKKDFKAHEMFD